MCLYHLTTIRKGRFWGLSPLRRFSQVHNPITSELREGINVLADWCQRDVRVISITQQIDLSGPGARCFDEPQDISH